MHVVGDAVLPRADGGGDGQGEVGGGGGDTPGLGHGHHVSPGVQGVPVPEGGEKLKYIHWI